MREKIGLTTAMVFNLLQGQMDKLEELLPGIEEFLCSVLSEEKLSSLAEERRQYYLERLDILKLPPSLPPRPPAFPLILPELVDVSVNHPEHKQITQSQEPDFAAYQREISRNLMMRIKAPPAQSKVKLYDDIDQEETSDDDDEDEQMEEQDLYEIPVSRTQPTIDVQAEPPEAEPPPEPNIGLSPIKNSDTELMPPPLPDTKPPPLPPRRDRAMSDSRSQSSIGSVIDDKPPQLPARPFLTPKSELPGPSDEHTDIDVDRTSYGSFDDDLHDTELLNKLEIRLPKPLKRQKKNRKLTGSRSSTQWEVTLPFHCLEDITLSGELYHKGKLSWTKRLIALSNGMLFGYKPEKMDGKPVLMVSLSGYEATFHERDTRRGFEIKLCQAHSESYHFAVDFKDWAQLWCDYISAMAEGRGPPGQYTHLARTTFQLHIDSSNGNKLDLTNSNSNLSTASSDNLEQDPEFVKRRVNSGGSNSKKMGKFASRATQFFETIGRKTGKKLGFMGNSTFSLYSTKDKSTSSESSQTTPTVSPQDVVFPEIDVKGRILAFSPPAKKRVKHQGYLNIFSSFNKRRWGKRWCLVTENMFECYQNETCKVLELDFLLRNCVLRRAVTETKSEYGLMLTEKNSEKITVEPLSKEDFPGWLWVFMKESATDSIPEGLEDYWEEQPYDVIHSDDLNHSAWSDMIGYSSIEMNSPKLHNMSMTRDEESHYELDEETETDSVSESRPLVDQKHQARDSGIAAESTDESIMPSDEQNASCSGELYTPVRRKSNVNIGSLQKKDILSEKELLLQKRNVVVLTDKDHLKSDSATKSTGDKSPHSQTDAHSDGSFVAELLTHFERFQSQIETTDSDSENKVDTAYSSGMSENNSSGGESRTDCASVRHSAADVEDEVDTTDHPADVEDEVDTTGHLVTPIDNVDVTNAISKKSESPYEQIKNPNDNPQIPNVPERNLSDHNADRTVNESADRTVKTVESENVERKNNLNSPRPESHPSTNEDSLDSVNTSRNSYTDENSHDKKSENLALSISQKIEGLRTKLVDLKKKRIAIRDHRIIAESDRDRALLDGEYNMLDENCKSVSNEISSLEEILKQNYNIGWMKIS